jgi:hypothetical protein
MTSPLPEFENCTVVLLGSFNPAIFHPEWFVRLGLLAEEAVDSDKIKVVSPEVTECVVGAVKVFCDSTRLVFSVGNMIDADKLQDVVLGTLRILAHVPLGAVGINQEGVFKAQSEDHWHKIGHTLVPKDPVWNKLGDAPGMQRISIKYPLQENPKIEQNFTVEPYPRTGPTHPAIKIGTNLHYQICSSSELSSGGESTKLALEFIADRWKSATGKVREVANVIFEEIKP